MSGRSWKPTWVGRPQGLGKQIGEMLDKYRFALKRAGSADGTLDGLKAKLRSIYGEDDYQRDVADLSDRELIELAGNLRIGVPFATPVFDGAREDDICAMLE